MQLSIDGGPKLDWDSLAESATDLTLKLGTDETLLSLLRRGHQVEVTSDGFDQTYNLDGTAQTIDGLTSCRQSAINAEVLAKEQNAILLDGLLATAGVWIGAYAVPLLPVIAVGVAAAALQGSSVTVEAPSIADVSPAIPRPESPKPVVIEKAASDAIEIPIEDKGGTYLVPVNVNGVITLNFTVDSGASNVMLSEDVLRTLVRAGTVQANDFGAPLTFTLADGSSISRDTVRIHSLKVGGVEIDDIEAGIAPTEGSLLLGQTFLGRFQSWSVDNSRHVLILRLKTPGTTAQAVGEDRLAKR